MMEAKKYFRLEDALEHIYLKSDGKPATNPPFDKRFDGDLKLLLSCVENNIYTGGEGIFEEPEKIDWSMVFDDYKAALKMKEEVDG